MSPQPVLDMALTPRPDVALAPHASAPEIDLSAMFRGLASNPDIPVDKLQALMDMQRAIVADRAKIAFNTAMAAAQKEMRPVSADATNPQTRSRYATYAKLDGALRPIYTEHGFALSFDTAESPVAESIRVVCLVSHLGGHERPYKVDMPADGKGAKGGDVMTKTHAAGAAMSYGMRYLLKMIFNVAVGEEDRDGNDVRDEKKHPVAPAGFDQWLTDLTAVADDGLPALQAAWTETNRTPRTKAFAEYLNKHQPQTWNDLKKKAALKAGAK